METQKLVAELIGTFLLVFVGTSAIVALGGAADPAAYLGIALAFGLTLVTLVYTLGPISGGHFNPAVTIGLVAARRHPTRDLVPYVVAQVVGAIIAALLVFNIGRNLPTAFATGYGSTVFNPLVGVAGAFIMEVVLTFILVWTVLSVTERNNPNPAFAGLAMGLALLVIHLAGIGISGAGVNPARSIGPALFAGGLPLSQLWLFLVAPIIGGVVAAGAYNALTTPAASTGTVPSDSRA